MLFYDSFHNNRCLASYTFVCEEGVKGKQFDIESTFQCGDMQKSGTVVTKWHISRKSLKLHAGTDDTLLSK